MSARRGESSIRLLDGPLTDGSQSIMAAAQELKSPLALIRQLSLMLEDGEVSKSEHQRMLRQISLTSERALRLTDDLTRSIQLSDAMFELEPINPQELCSGIVQELRPMFYQHGRHVKLAQRKKSILLVANRDLLRRIIMNFCENALHYSEQDNPVEIQVGLLNAGKTVRLGVRDHGPALACNTLNTLKDRLSGSSSTTVYARPQSSGLAIYIASKFADSMNGTIGVTRHHDGSTFYVDLQSSRQLSLL
jgi:two-component system sensor histidine kinase ChvG